MITEKINFLGEYPIDDIYIDSISSKMNEDEENLRIYIMNFIIDNKRPFEIGDLTSEVCSELKIDFNKSTSILYSIRDKGGLVMEDNKVKFIYPVSTQKTNHKVTLEDGRSFYAMCAIDSLGSHFTFKTSIKVESTCSECGERIQVEVENGKIKSYYPKDMHILHVNMKKFDNWGGSC